MPHNETLTLEKRFARPLTTRVGVIRSILARRVRAEDLAEEWDLGREAEDAGHWVQGVVSLVPAAEGLVPLAVGGVARVAPGFLAPTYQGLH